MDIRKLQHHIVDALEDVKAQDIQVFDTTQLTSLFDRVVLASGTSNRQTRALANSVREKVKESGGYIGSVEGEDTGEWVLVDCGDAIVHVMQPAIRQYYRLEEIWGGKPVDVKREYKAFVAEGSPEKPSRKAPKRKTLKTTEAKELATITKPTTKKAAAKKAPAKKAAGRPAAKPAVAKRAPAKAAAAKSAAKPATKSPGKSPAKGVAKNTAGAMPKKTASKSTAAKRPATKKAH
jgi:ribosome-associated protein